VTTSRQPRANARQRQTSSARQRRPDAAGRQQAPSSSRGQPTSSSGRQPARSSRHQPADKRAGSIKRAPFVLTATAAGLAGVLAFHTRSATQSAPSAAATGAKKPTPASSTTGSPTSSAHNSATSSTPTTRPNTAPPATSNSATGPAEQYGYGVLAVKVTVSGGRITDLSVPNLQTAEAYSQQLADAVIPMLRRQVLQVQSANIAGVSGATYTSEAYAISLQKALQSLHFA